MSTNTTNTFFPGSIHSFSLSMHFDSLIPLSTTRASSMLFSSGGPGSKLGEATGTSSAFTVKTPSFGVSGKGSPKPTLTPTRIWVFPMKTLAEPSAFSIMPCSILISRVSSKPLSSKRLPFSINCSICLSLTLVTSDDIILQPLLRPCTWS